MEDSRDVDGHTLSMLKTPEYLLQQVLGPMQSCLGNVTSCQQILFADDDAQLMAEELFPNLQKEGKLRTAALQKLYMLTDGENQSNR